MPNLSREIIFDDDVQAKITVALEQAYGVAKRSYGPKAGIALIEQPYGDPTASRDGVTNLKKVYLSDPYENMVAAIAKQASEQNNRKVGDGTTAVTILAYHLFLEARKLIAGGIGRMEVSRLLDLASAKILDALDESSIEVNEKITKNVAIVSSGDPEIGKMIADVIDEVGIEGGVTIEDFKGIGIFNEVVDGFYFPKGYTSVNLINDPVNLESHHIDTPILITEKRLATSTDIAPILNAIVGSGVKDLVIIGEVSEEALNVLLLNRLKGIISTCVVDVPVYAGSRTLFLEDLGVLTGGKVLPPGANPNDFTTDLLGFAEKVEVTGYSTAIIGSDGAEEDINMRLEELRKQQQEATHPTDVQAVKDRLARLTGKIAIIRVGGATEVEQQEVKLRVQDAICAVQAAIKGGVSPGGGVTLVHMDTHAGQFANAYKEPFKQLVSNAGLNPEAYLAKVEAEGDMWHGFDLKDPTDRPINLLKAGIVDPTLVLKEVVQNATSIVAKLITTNTMMVYKEREVRHE